MPRKGPVPKRVVLPDPVYDSELVARFINRMMKGGKKAVAEAVFYKAMEIVEQKTGKPAMEVFEQAIENVAPQVEVRPVEWAVRPIRCRWRCAPNADARSRSAGL
jgi:small subunit ribosomal protein S7